jgi:hypothetical protein
MLKQAKQISAEQAAGPVRSRSWIDYGFCLGQPNLFDKGSFPPPIPIFASNWRATPARPT